MAADSGTAPDELRDIELTRIGPRPNQSRKHFDEEALQQLADSIREEGVIQPIVVRPFAGEPASDVETYEIIAGERRWRASKLAERATIPCVIRRGLPDGRVRVIHLIENLQREDLNFAEKCAATAQLVTELEKELKVSPDPNGLTALDLAAKKIGKTGKGGANVSRSWVSRHAAVMDFSNDIQKLVADGKVDSVDIAHELQKLQGLSKGKFDAAVERIKDPKHWRGPITREALRDEVKSAEDLIKYRQEQAKNRADAKKKQAGSGQKTKAPAPTSRDDREKQIKLLKPDVEKVAAAIHQAISKVSGVTCKNVYQAPVRVSDELPQAYQNTPIPRTVGEVKFSLYLSGSVDSINKAFEALAPGGKLELSSDYNDAPQFTVSEARKIEQAIGRKLKWDATDTIAATALQFRAKLESAKSPLSYWPEPKAEAAAPTAKKAAAKKATPAKPQAAAKKTPAKKAAPKKK